MTKCRFCHCKDCNAKITAVGINLDCLIRPEHSTALEQPEKNLNHISSGIKTACGSATQTESTSSFSCETNTIKEALGRRGERGGAEPVGFTGNKKPVEERRRTTLSDERQTQLPTIHPAPSSPIPPPPDCQGLTAAFVRLSWWISVAETPIKLLLSHRDTFSHCGEKWFQRNFKVTFFHSFIHNNRLLTMCLNRPDQLFLQITKNELWKRSRKQKWERDMKGNSSKQQLLPQKCFHATLPTSLHVHGRTMKTNGLKESGRSCKDWQTMVTNKVAFNFNQTKRFYTE